MAHARRRRSRARRDRSRDRASTPGRRRRPPLTAWRAASFALPIGLLLCAAAASSRCAAGAASRRLAGRAAGGGDGAVDLLRIGARFNPGTRPGRLLSRDAEGARAAGRVARRTVRRGRGHALGDGLHVRPRGRPRPRRHRAGGLRRRAAGHGRLHRPDGVSLPSPAARRAVPGFPEHTRAALSGRRDPWRHDAVGRASRSDSSECATRTRCARGWRARDGLPRPRLRARARARSFRGGAQLLSIERHGPEELRVRVRCERPRVLVLPESDDGGWTREPQRRAARDAERRRRLSRDPGSRGRDRRSVCRYAPPGLRAGVLVSALSALAMLAAVAIRARRAMIRRVLAAYAALAAPHGLRPRVPRTASRADRLRAAAAARGVPARARRQRRAVGRADAVSALDSSRLRRLPPRAAAPALRRQRMRRAALGQSSGPGVDAHDLDHLAAARAVGAGGRRGAATVARGGGRVSLPAAARNLGARLGGRRPRLRLRARRSPSGSTIR